MLKTQPKRYNNKAISVEINNPIPMKNNNLFSFCFLELSFIFLESNNEKIIATIDSMIKTKYLTRLYIYYSSLSNISFVLL